MSSSSQRVEREVFPGDPLATIEEYLPGKGTYVDEEGLIRAAVQGVAVFDEQQKRVSVRPRRQVKLPQQGSEVVALVDQVRHDVVIVDIYGVVTTAPRPRWLYELSGPLTAGIPIANVADEFIKDLHDYYRIGDIIVAKVVGTNPYTLLTKPPQYGTLYGICSRCGGLLVYNSERSMKCVRCGNVEKRKASILGKNKAFRIDIRRLMVKTHYPW